MDHHVSIFVFFVFFEVDRTVDHLVSIFVFFEVGIRADHTFDTYVARKTSTMSSRINDTGGAVAHLISSICESRVSFCQNTFHSKNKEALEFNI